MHTSNPPTYTLSELCLLAELPARTVRYYVQIGLVDRPEGETRAARYGAAQLEQLLQIKKWTAAGVSLDRIRSLLHGEPPSVKPPPPAMGDVRVCSHISLGPGLELVVDPHAAGISPEQLRALVRALGSAARTVLSGTDPLENPERPGPELHSQNPRSQAGTPLSDDRT